MVGDCGSTVGRSAVLVLHFDNEVHIHMQRQLVHVVRVARIPTGILAVVQNNAIRT